MYSKTIPLLAIFTIIFSTDMLIAVPQNRLFHELVSPLPVTRESECLYFHHSADEVEMLCTVPGYASIEMSALSETPEGFTVIRELDRHWYLVALPADINTLKSVRHLGITQLFPAYSNESGQMLWLTDIVLVRPVEADWSGVEDSLISTAGEPSSLSGVFAYRSSDPISTSNEWTRSGEVLWAQPDFIRSYQSRFNGGAANLVRGFN